MMFLRLSHCKGPLIAWHHTPVALLFVSITGLSGPGRCGIARILLTVVLKDKQTVQSGGKYALCATGEKTFVIYFFC